MKRKGISHDDASVGGILLCFCPPLIVFVLGGFFCLFLWMNGLSLHSRVKPTMTLEQIKINPCPGCFQKPFNISWANSTYCCQIQALQVNFQPGQCRLGQFCLFQYLPMLQEYEKVLKEQKQLQQSKETVLKTFGWSCLIGPIYLLIWGFIVCIIRTNKKIKEKIKERIKKNNQEKENSIHQLVEPKASIQRIADDLSQPDLIA